MQISIERNHYSINRITSSSWSWNIVLNIASLKASVNLDSRKSEKYRVKQIAVQAASGTSKVNTRASLHITYNFPSGSYCELSARDSTRVSLTCKYRAADDGRFSQSGVRDATKLHVGVYHIRMFRVWRWARAHAARCVSTFTKWRGLPWEVGCNHSDVKVSRSRTHAREPARLPVTRESPGPRGLGIPSRQFTWLVVPPKREGRGTIGGEGELKHLHISSLSLPSPSPPPVRISGAIG